VLRRETEKIMSVEMHGRPRNPGRIIGGIAVVLVGLSMLAGQIGFHDLHLSGRYWPLILIAMGAVRLAEGPGRDGRPRSWRAGVWLVFLGVWGLVNEFHAFGLDYGSSWPLLIIGAGVGMVWRAVEHPAARGPIRED
jgi:hypothetical protein